MFTTKDKGFGIEILDSEGRTILIVVAEHTTKVADWIVGLMNADEEAHGMDGAPGTEAA